MKKMISLMIGLAVLLVGMSVSVKADGIFWDVTVQTGSSGWSSTGDTDVDRSAIKGAYVNKTVDECRIEVDNTIGGNGDNKVTWITFCEKNDSVSQDCIIGTMVNVTTSGKQGLNVTDGEKNWTDWFTCNVVAGNDYFLSAWWSAAYGVMGWSGSGDQSWYQDNAGNKAIDPIWNSDGTTKTWLMPFGRMEGRNVSNAAPSTPTLLVANNSYFNVLPVLLNYSSSDVEDDEITYSIYIDGILNGTSTLNWSFNASDGNYTWQVSATDGMDGSANSSIRQFAIDTVVPIISWVAPNTGNTSSTSTDSFTLDITVSDDNLFRANMTLFSENGSILYYNYSGDLSAHTTWNFTTVLNLTNWTDQVFVVETSVTDDHTDGPTPKKGKKGEDRIMFNSTDDVQQSEVKMVFVEKDNKLTDVPGNLVTTFSSGDEWDIAFTVIKPETHIIFNVTTNVPIIYRSSVSGIDGHFIWGDYFHDFSVSKTFWVNGGERTAELIVTRVDDYNYLVEWVPDINLEGNDVVFIDPVTGGLNTVTEHKTLTMDRIPIISNINLTSSEDGDTTETYNATGDLTPTFAFTTSEHTNASISDSNSSFLACETTGQFNHVCTLPYSRVWACAATNVFYVNVTDNMDTSVYDDWDVFSCNPVSAAGDSFEFQQCIAIDWFNNTHIRYNKTITGINYYADQKEFDISNDPTAGWTLVTGADPLVVAGQASNTAVYQNTSLRPLAKDSWFNQSAITINGTDSNRLDMILPIDPPSAFAKDGVVDCAFNPVVDVETYVPFTLTFINDGLFYLNKELKAAGFAKNNTGCKVVIDNSVGGQLAIG